MYLLLTAVVIILTLSYPSVDGYRWVQVNPNNNYMPPDAVYLNSELKTHVGRARHFDEILPAEVYNNTYALVYSCNELIEKNTFEVLVDAEDCHFDETELIAKNLPQTILHVGEKDTGEPIYLGWTSDGEYKRLASVLISSDEITLWPGTRGSALGFLCKDSNRWNDSSSVTVPAGAIYGGKSVNDTDIYVARLKRDCELFPGQADPTLGLTSATNHFYSLPMRSVYCQFLVEGVHKYRWVSTGYGLVPDYAVVGGKSNNTGEFKYITRSNQTLSYETFARAYYFQRPYEVLVRDEQ